MENHIILDERWNRCYVETYTDYILYHRDYLIQVCQIIFVQIMYLQVNPSRPS